MTTKSRSTKKEVSPKAGPLESLKRKDYCEMCGNQKKNARLEPAFDPSGEPKTLCLDCRIGSAELLADRRIKFSSRQTDTLIAALRLWQRAPAYPEIEIAEEHGKMLSDKEIDDLIATQINV
jgi:hypothetical protein